MDWDWKEFAFDSLAFELTSDGGFGEHNDAGSFDLVRKTAVETTKDSRNSKIVSSSSTSGSSKRSRIQNGSQNMTCSVDGCNSDLSNCRDYHRRHRVCEKHSKTPVVLVGGKEQRFCQQCSRYEFNLHFWRWWREIFSFIVILLFCNRGWCLIIIVDFIRWGNLMRLRGAAGNVWMGIIGAEGSRSHLHYWWLLRKSLAITKVGWDPNILKMIFYWCLDDKAMMVDYNFKNCHQRWLWKRYSWYDKVE